MKYAKNIIAVGGPIGIGKSTLVGSLEFTNIQELDGNSSLETELLDRMYKNDDIALHTFQIHLITKKADIYKKMVQNQETVIFDRTIFEDIMFARRKITNESTMKYYKQVWNDLVNQMKYNYGLPSLYILLESKWDTARDRILKRGRSFEIEMLKKDEKKFKELHEMYENEFPKILKDCGIKFIKIKTDNKEIFDVRNDVKKELKKYGFYK